jgi:hypothetical protein
MNKLPVIQYLLQKNVTIDQESERSARINFSKFQPEILRYINLTKEFNKIKNNKKDEVLRFINNYKADQDAYKFLVNFLFMESINELKRGRGIEATPFYGVYTDLAKQNLSNPETNFKLSQIFKTSQTFDKPEKFTGVYEFIKEAAKANNLALDQNLINKLVLSKQIRKNSAFLDCRIHCGQN